MKDQYSIKKIITFIIITLIILVIFYGLTVLILDNKKTKELEKEIETSIQYEEIVVGNIYNQNESEYYVLATLSSDSKSSSYISDLNTYSSSDNALKTYTIDLDKGFNKKYVSDISNYDSIYPVFSKSTLLKIVDKKITEVYEGTEISAQIEKLNSSIEE